MKNFKSKRDSPYFDYHPLQDSWIRLVSIEKAIDVSDIHEELKINLISSPLSTDPPYTALSYTCGDPSPNTDPCTNISTKVFRCYPVLCRDRIILASRDLRDALRRIRQFQSWRTHGEEMFDSYKEPNSKTLLERAYGATAYFWIDAQSISQEDLRERSQQVSLMGKICTQASHTIVWLGESYEYIAGAQPYLGKVAQNAGVEVSTSTDHVPSPNQGYKGLKDLDTEEQVAFLAIMSRNCFFRMWVLQERVLSPRIGVLLGDLCFNYQLLLHAANVECVNGRDYSFAKSAFAAAKRFPDFASTAVTERVFNSIQKPVLATARRRLRAVSRRTFFLSLLQATR
ncbi:uncharacterized protein EKO05_0009857 [Ascochyta rabiei]|uniref:uncharacterized protein n=1 Tax=Didymella rabiei TaxID=5454 RepID=UPI0022055FD7|nr:uncharacterized protein EKO05_0009857 [Ascochyta rabiei]UPX19599.1 hypothetical protein EKO05_0009857 [Ascochyta rabiei]